MRRHRQYVLSLLVTLAASGVASAQQQERSEPPIAEVDPAPSSSGGRDGPSDPGLALEVQARLYQAFPTSNMSVLVRYGVATLDGVVRSEPDRHRAEEIALQVPGVESVVNDLSVAPPVTVAAADEAQAVTARQNESVEDRIEQQLRTDAVLGSRDIRVVADNLTNTVTLTGTVSTEEEKEQAGRIAVNEFPVGQVRNQLEVRQRL
jgi:osmotically-inducible protein OsmY